MAALNTLGFTLDVGVPIPPRKGRINKDEWTRWPFADMDVGDSFFAPGVSLGARTASQDYAWMHPGVKFTTRSFDEDPITKLPGLRVWRIR